MAPFRIGRSAENRIIKDKRRGRIERRDERRENRDPLDFGFPSVNAGQAAALGVPLYSMLDNQNARDQLINEGLDLGVEDFAPVVPNVVSARRPNFTTKTRLPGGSSLAEREAGLRFAEAQNNQREDQFNEFNERHITDQRSRAAQIQNAAEAQNVQARNRAKYVNLNTKLSRVGAAQDQATASQEALFHNLMGITNQKTQGNAAIDAAIVSEQIRSGALSGQEALDAIQQVKGATYRKRRKRI